MAFGRVVKVEGMEGTYVVIGFTDHNSGNYGACSFDETYRLVPMNELENKEYITGNEGFEVHVTGIKRTPNITTVENIIPYKIEKEIRYKVSKMKPKTITIYE